MVSGAKQLGGRLWPPSCSVTIPSDTGTQVFLLSQLTSHTFLKGTPICSCVQKRTPPWYTQPYTLSICTRNRRARTQGEGTEEEGRDAGEPRACLPIHPSKPGEGSAQTLQSLRAKIVIFPASLPCFRGWHANSALGDGGAMAPTCALNMVQKGTSSCHLLETTLEVLPITPGYHQHLL